MNDAIGALRVKIGHSEFGKKTGLAIAGWKPLWVVDFPMFEYDEEDGRYTAAHHPFTSPRTATRTSSNPIRARPSPRPTTWC